MVLGDITLHTPGDSLTVVPVADANGEMPTRGDLVTPVGESGLGTHVALPSEVGVSLAKLARVPYGFNEDQQGSYTEGAQADGDSPRDPLGDALVHHHVEWFGPSDGYSPSIGDKVVDDAGGTVAAYDTTATADGGAGHSAEDLFGMVWRTRPHADGTAGKAAVARFR